jgi:ABC-type multidrug transport system fused ATPase/permease subunit
MQIFKYYFFLLNSLELKQALLLLIMIITMTFLDLIAVTSVLPFMTVLANPSFIETNIILNTMYQYLIVIGVKNSQQFQFILGIFLLGLLITSLIFKAFTAYKQIQFVQMKEYSISKRLIEGYLYQSYKWFLSRHSADLGKTILSEVQQVVLRGMNSLFELIAKGLLTIALLTLLIIVDPKVALIVVSTLAIIYVLVFSFFRTFIHRLGKKSLLNNKLRFTLVGESFGAIKEIKVGGLEETYIKSFSNCAEAYAKAQTFSQLVSILPRYILEIIAFGGMILILLYITLQSGGLNDSLPIISLYIFAGYRLMPALQQIYSSFVQISFIGPSLEELFVDLRNLKSRTLTTTQDQGILSINKKITLKNIYYNYQNESRTALKGINLSIPAKSIVGIVGVTGSGKTTLSDIILGILEPQKGTLEVDGKIITKQNLRSWQRSIGYVSQHIYLSDDTIEANIAFGAESKDINQDRLLKSAKIANIHKFIIDELPKQYQTKIGERGIKLSGGQRQRIGIARALYNYPQVLILDEATSALDNQTENKVMDEIKKLRKKTTIIMIAHRLTTVKNCDIIFKLENGQLVAQGNFKELEKKNKFFTHI